jgi:hypothetical protein
LGIALIYSCRKPLKDIQDYYPNLKTVSATVLPDGSVEVKGEIISEGAAPVEYWGFCAGTMPEPKMLDAQAIADNTFTVIYSGFSTNTKYYFRTWATNQYGYSYGNILYLDSISATPVTPPCTPPPNSVNIGGANPTENYITIGTPAFNMTSNTWDFQAQSNSNVVNFKFGENLKTKVFTTTTISSSPGAGKVYISFSSGFISGVLNTGSLVYVNQINSTTWNVTICNALWTYNTSTFYFTTEFTCPL